MFGTMTLIASMQLKLTQELMNCYTQEGRAVRIYPSCVKSRFKMHLILTRVVVCIWMVQN